MAKTSTQAKRKWNKENYTEFRAIIPKEIGMRFREVCNEKGISYNSILTKSIIDFLEENEKNSKEETQ